VRGKGQDPQGMGATVAYLSRIAASIALFPTDKPERAHPSLHCTKGSFMTKHHQDYIPGPDLQFHEWANNFYNYALLHFTPWQAPSPQTSIGALIATFNEAFIAAQDPNHGKVDTHKKDEARAALERACRQYYSAWINGNPQVPNSDRDGLRVPIHDGTRTPSTPPTTIPQADKIDTSILRQVTVHFRDAGSDHRAKPDGVHGCEVRWNILASPPTHVDDLTHSTFDTRTPVTLSFDESQRGKWLYFCLRWEGPTGLKGPDGEIYSVVVP
jgi:hypothetical protein